MIRIFMLFVSVGFLAGCTDERDIEEDRYCSMVKLWKTDAAAGIAPKNRNGWPPYKGMEGCR